MAADGVPPLAYGGQEDHPRRCGRRIGVELGFPTAQSSVAFLFFSTPRCSRTCLGHSLALFGSVAV